VTLNQQNAQTCSFCYITLNIATCFISKGASSGSQNKAIQHETKLVTLVHN